MRIAEGRLTKFLQNEELDPDNVEELSPSDSNAIVIEKGTFSWNKELDSPCLVNINMNIKKGSLVAVVGRVGSGKSSLCSAILGMMQKNTGTVGVKVGLMIG